MAIDLDIQLKEEYLSVRMTGEWSLVAACDAFKKMLDAADGHGATKILVDCLQLQGRPSTLDIFHYAEFGAQELAKPAKSGQRRYLHLAYIATAPIADKEHFGALVARNRGVDVITVDTVAEGLEWLRDQSP